MTAGPGGHSATLRELLVTHLDRHFMTADPGDHSATARVTGCNSTVSDWVPTWSYW